MKVREGQVKKVMNRKAIEKTNPDIMLRCKCDHAALQIIHWPKEEDFEVFLWWRGFSPKMSLLERLKWCWHVLISGEPNGDNVLLTREAAVALSSFIENCDNHYRERTLVEVTSESIDAMQEAHEATANSTLRFGPADSDSEGRR
jgi:hypothetical protein